MATYLKAPASGATSYYVEDLRPIIANVDPVETPVFTLSGDVSARGVTHQWMTDTLSAAVIDPKVQGSLLAPTNYGKPTRVTNTCQIDRKDIGVTMTEQAVDHAGIEDAYGYQVMKALKNLARDSEKAIIQATESTVDPRQMAGLSAQITTNTVAGAGSSTLGDLTFTAFSDGQQQVYLASGDQPDLFVVHPKLKRQVSTWFTSISAHNYDINGKTLPMSIMAVDTDFGLVKIVPDRYCPLASVGGTNDVQAESYLVRMDMINKAWLIPTQAGSQAQDGDVLPGMVYQEWTLEVLNEKAFAKFTTSTSITLGTVL